MLLAYSSKRYTFLNYIIFANFCWKVVDNCIKFVGKYVNLANLSNTKRYTFLAVKVYLFCAQKNGKLTKYLYY
mgnify:FL=1